MDLLDRLAAALGDRYTIQRELGRGGMARVFLARERHPERQVAVKLLDPDLAAVLGPDRFLREVDLASKLTHPHVLPVFAAGQADGLLYYVMPYVEGESLRQRLDREKQLRLDDALQIARDVADALSYAHGQGVVHRDIKPDNILLESGHAVVADFGIARALTVAGGDRLTERGIAVGTPEYMSPEQSSGEQDVDGRSDIYSLGCVLYEMLGGTPPFSGRSAQAIIARHLSEPPPPLRIVRPTVPRRVLRIVEQSLQKVPADRFATAAQLAEALARSHAEIGAPPRVGLPRVPRMVAIAIVTVGMLAAGWRVLSTRSDLDMSEMVVFPLAVTGAEHADRRLGQSVALAVSWALNTTTHFRAVDGWQLLDERQREATGGVPQHALRQAARERGAGYLVSGSVLVGDSVRMVLDVYDAASNAQVHRALAVDRAGDPWALGLRGATEIVRTLIGADEPFDASMLAGHSPAVLEAFLRGEHAYRRAHFRDALTHYRAALTADTTFTLAALRVAQAARWIHDERLEASVLPMLGRAGSLPPRYVHFARGLQAYLTFDADSAVAAFQRAIALDPRWHEAWMALGEVYTHLLPRGPPPDSMAEVAFREVRRLDPGFTPALYHLTQVALWNGNAKWAEQLLDELRAATVDTVLLEATDLLVRCATGSPRVVDWRSAVRRRARVVYEAALRLTGGGLRYPDCAGAAWRALLDHDTTGNYRFGGLLGLQSVLIARQRWTELRALLDADSVFDAALLGDLYIHAATAGAPVGDRATPWADTIRALVARDTSASPVRLWFLGIWEAHGGQGDEADRIAARLTAGDALRRMKPEDARLRRLLAGSVAARAAVARGDSARAVELLLALTPTGGTQALSWSPWESLGGERVLLAELLLARGAAAEALRVARHLDAPAPVTYATYLPASLDIRERAARVLGYQQLSAELRERRIALLK